MSLINAADVTEESIDIQSFESLPYVSLYKTKLTPYEYAQKLNAFHWVYTDFVTSAVIYNLESLYDQGILDAKKL